MNSKDNWSLIINSDSKNFSFNYKEIIEYWDLLKMLVKRDVISFYKQTIFGPLWFFLQPLFTTIIFTFVFGNLAGLKTNNIPQPLFYLSGITAWNYFSECVIKTSTVFKDNTNLFGKIYFPRIIMPLSIVISNLIKFFVQFILFIIVLMYYYFFTNFKFNFNLTILFFPILVLLMGLLGLALGLIITSLTIKYKDLVFLISFAIQLLMYCTTVIYPLNNINIKYQYLIILNPMTSIIETLRYSIFQNGIFLGSGLVYTGSVTIILLFFGFTLFNKVEKSFIDTI
jgi:lipopolysaccharide transport system permease protein